MECTHDASTCCLPLSRCDGSVAVLIVTASNRDIRRFQVGDYMVRSLVGRGHQIHLQHSTPDVAHLRLPPAHPARHGWSTHAQPRTINVCVTTLIISTESRSPYSPARGQEQIHTEAVATDQAPRQTLRLICSKEILRRRRCIRPRLRMQRSSASHAWAGEAPSLCRHQMTTPHMRTCDQSWSYRR